MNRMRVRSSHLVMLAGALLLAAGIFALAHPDQVQAVSSYLPQARTKYPNIVNTPLNSCSLCHLSDGVSLNGYGSDYGAQGHSFPAIEGLDSDHDGYTNLQEIQALTWPGDPASHPGGANTPTPTPTCTPLPAATATPTCTPPPGGSTATPTATAVSGAPTPTSPPPAPRLALLGIVNRIPEGSGHRGNWTVHGRTVRVTENTWIEQSRLLGEDGQHALVWVFGTRNADGSATASYIRVLAADDNDSSPESQ